MDSVLIDTNILIYAYDQNAPVKQRRAMKSSVDYGLPGPA